MIIDLVEIEGSSRPFEVGFTSEELDLDIPDLRLTGDVRATGEAVKRAAQIEVSGSFKAPVEVDCTRCLEPVSQDLQVEFAVSFVTAENFTSDKEREVAAEDLDTDVLDSDRLDLKEILREQILLNLPEQLFCTPDCRGLCPQCGGNRNLIDCKCNEIEPDPRWAALKNLK